MAKLVSLDPIARNLIKKRLAELHPAPKWKFGNPQKTAAILLPLCLVSGVPSVLFTLRSPNLRSHSGQVSFPGGMGEHGESSIQTALRETKEEIYIESNNITVLGEMHPVPDITRKIKVTTMVAYIGNIDANEMRFNTDEVSKIFTVPIAYLLNPESQKYSVYHVDTPYWIYEDLTIWGLTAYVLFNFLQKVLIDTQSKI